MLPIFFALAINLAVAAPLLGQTPFYQGKTVQIRVGFAAGGAFDVWARVIAHYLGKYIPGHPTFVVQNMTGGGSMIAANYVYSVAKPDGLTLGVVSPAMYIDQISGKKEVKFDWFKFGYIGSPEKTDRIFYIRSDSGVKALEDMRGIAEPAKCGSTGIGTAAYYFPRLLQDSFGLKIMMVPGYPGAADANLAIEKNEIQCWSVLWQRTGTHLVQDRFRSCAGAGRQKARSTHGAGADVVGSARQTSRQRIHAAQRQIIVVARRYGTAAFWPARYAR